MGSQLALEGIGKRFGGYDAVADCTFAVAERSIHALIGPNGAGKTTLFNLISGVLVPTAGRLRFRDIDYTGRRADQIAAMGIARNFQHVRLIRGLSVLENVLVGRHARLSGGFLSAIVGWRGRGARSERAGRQRAEDLLAFVGLADRRTTPVADLTLVEQRRLEIARALASDPTLVLLDEPAAGMTPVEVDGLIDLVRTVRDQGTTVLLVEHHMRLVMTVADTVTVLKTGRVLAQGKPAEIQEHPEVIAAYLGNEGWAF